MNHLAARTVAILLAIMLSSALRGVTRPTAGSTPSPGPSTTSGPASGTAGGAATLTPQQQEALRLAIIKLSQNPVGTITIVPFQNNFNYGVGPYARFQYNLNVQPVIPIMLSPKLNLIARTIIPIIDQPSAAVPSVCASEFGCGSTFGIGDTQEQLFFAPKTKPHALIWGLGPLFQFPTASPTTLGSGTWNAGFDMVALVTPGKWVIGALINQQWSFTGQTNRPNVSAFLVQPFVNDNLRDGWALSVAPSITANWNATQDKWAVPLGGGISKTFKAGDQLMSLAVSYYTYVARPVSAPQTQLRVQWSLLYPIKRGIDISELLKEAQ